MFIVRYADDVIFAFQYRNDAERFRAALAERLRQFGLELHPEKTRLIEFGRFAEPNRKNRGQGPPETFDFLGFTHICGRSQEGKFQVKRRTVAKRMRARLLAIKLELRKRMHDPVSDTGKWLRRVITGYYRYHAVPGNLPMMARFRHRITRLWRHALIRRGGKRPPNWAETDFALWTVVAGTHQSTSLIRDTVLRLNIQGGSRMRETRSYGSVRGARRETRPYRDSQHLTFSEASLRYVKCWNVPCPMSNVSVKQPCRVSLRTAARSDRHSSPSYKPIHRL